MASKAENTKVTGSTKVVSIKVKDGDKEVDASYTAPADFKAFLAWLPGLPPASEDPKVMTQERAYDLFEYALDLKTRASVRESTAVTQPIIATQKWGKVNLVTGEAEKLGPIPLAKRVAMINMAFANAAEYEKPAPKAVQKAREDLLTGKQVTEKNGALVVAAARQSSPTK